MIFIFKSLDFTVCRMVVLGYTKTERNKTKGDAMTGFRPALDKAIRDNFTSRAECAKYMGWQECTVSKVVNGHRALHESEISQLVNKFNIQTNEQFHAIFFGR